MIEAFNKMKGVLPKLYFDKVTITGTAPTTNGDFDDETPVTIVENYPAKVVLNTLKTSNQTEFGTDEYDAKLLLDPSIQVPAGSKIVVTDVNGVVTKYKQTSKGYRGYISHQEIAMLRDERA